MIQVPIGSIHPHPGNPRVGNVGVIAGSLRRNGQYKPILVHRPSMNILAGTHTWMAAKQLGWDTITAVFTDVSERQAQTIMLADNRAADSGWTDETLAMDILLTLPDLEGTGYTAADTELPPLPEDWPPQQPPAGGEAQTPTGAAREPQKTTQPFDVGAVHGWVEDYEYDRWRAGLPKPAGEAAAELMRRIGLGIEPSKQPTAPQEQAMVPITSLNPYPGNPRQGDIGLIADLLRIHGQWRPIVVSRTTRNILAGNSTADAALQLGWSTIWVTWVDTDDEGEKRIVIADNRTSDLATYDTDALAAAIAQTIIGDNGYTLADLDDVRAGKSLRETPRTGGTRVRVGSVSFKTSYQSLASLQFTPHLTIPQAAERIGIRPDRTGTEGNRANSIQ